MTNKVYKQNSRRNFMVDDIVTTGVDDLLALLKEVDKIPMLDASKKLKVPTETLQSWVDFLVEEKIVGLEYKFTKPYIYLNRDAVTKKNDSLPSLSEIKSVYIKRAKDKKIPLQQIPALWDAHIRQELTFMEPYFNERAQKKGVQDLVKRKKLWNDYVNDLMNRLRSA